ncbi:cytochrome b/b6 domain-containing protein [Arthrobacter sp. CC3]|uniref:cytochrome b/b6 domain-containing protein n=1 Tax=Arthrobacter sp. CC3 TaxID=3029185 RepID=UPI003265E49D
MKTLTRLASLTAPNGSKWRTLAWAVPGGILLLAIVVLAAKLLRTLPDVQSFIIEFPGETQLPANAPVGLPSWLAWQHFLNALFIMLIIRTGIQVRTVQRPAAYWTRNNSGPIRTKGRPAKISLDLWLHLTMDFLWVLNGLVFFVLIFATGQWMRIVPTHWEVLPNALSAALQYASLQWPTENGWVNYNSLQVLAYFLTVFIAAPLAIITGLRMSGAWPKSTAKLNMVYPIEVARAIHFPVMLYFAGFIIVHVTLVASTGLLRNLNHMYGSRDGESWDGFWIFAASVAVMIALWLFARPVFLRPVAALTGSVTR